MEEVSSFVLCINGEKKQLLLHLKTEHLADISVECIVKNYTSVCLPYGMLRNGRICLVYPHTGPEAEEAWQWLECSHEGKCGLNPIFCFLMYSTGAKSWAEYLSAWVTSEVRKMCIYIFISLQTDEGT